jgi:predicted RNase H-like HicB family nuclease
VLRVVKSYADRYLKTDSGYMGQPVEWPEVISEGKTIEKCRTMLKDAVKEMMPVYEQQGREIPVGGGLLEQVLIEAWLVS